MKGLGLLIATSMAMILPSAGAAGCQYDMQCKGERICQRGMCVGPEAEDKDIDKAPPPAVRSLPPTTGPRYCCTVAGKLRLNRSSRSEGDIINLGDACQGSTASGKPVPGTACN